MRNRFLAAVLSGFSLYACLPADPSPISAAYDHTADSLAFARVLQSHLDAVACRDLAALRPTLMPGNRMELILPGTAPTYTVEAFMSFHVTFFQDTTWTFEPEILTTHIGRDLGIAHTEIVYREPDRDGKPYFNRVAVGYVLEKIDGQW